MDRNAQPVTALDGVALVTGGGRGIGAAIARGLAAAGMRVVVTGRTAGPLEALASEVDGEALVGDVSSADDVRRWFDAVGGVDLLVNNAGLLGPQEVEWEANPQAWWRTFEVNVRGPFLCCREAVPRMAAAGGGRIINVTSGAAYMSGGPSDGAYGPSKAALHRYSEILATQAQPLGVHVFSISPGLIRTGMNSGFFGDDAPWASPEVPAALVRLLASGRADALAGRFLHATLDDVEDLIRRADQVEAEDLNAIRLRR